MKKLVLTTVCAMALAGAAFAQGTVNYLSISAAAFVVNTNSTQYSPLFGGGATGIGSTGLTGLAANGYYYELLYNTTYGGNNTPLSTPTLAQLLGGTWLDAGLSAANSVGNNGSATPIGGTTSSTVPWAHGISNNIIMVGWSANLGSSWLSVSNELANWALDQIAGAYFGISTGGVINPGAGNPGATIFALSPQANVGRGINSQNTQLYLIPVVPEPASLALAGLGGLSLLLFRRQRK